MCCEIWKIHTLNNNKISKFLTFLPHNYENCYTISSFHHDLLIDIEQIKYMLM